MTFRTGGVLSSSLAPLDNGDASQERMADSPPKILIVDDDPGIVRALSSRCRRLGLDVETAAGGMQAILKTRHWAPEVLILDLDMPDVDGFRVCEMLLDSRMPAINVIVLTGNGDDETSVRCESLGAFLVTKNSNAWDNIHLILAELLKIDQPSVAGGRSRLRSSSSAANMLPTLGARVLVVDDDLDVVTFLMSRLQKMKATVICADNGIDGYRMAIREEPHAVITDYLMPNGGGHSLIWRLRDRPESAALPIFVISGELETPDRPLPRRRDIVGPKAATAVFSKPFVFDEIAVALKLHCPMFKNLAEK